jgi:hypothetical protein
MLQAYLVLANAPIVRKTLHTAQKEGSQELSHVQKINKQGGCTRENGTAASLSWSGLK